MKTINVNISRNLLYYDGLIAFVASDAVGAKYCCALFERDEKQDKFICVPISPQKLDSIMVGKLDVRNVFENPELDAFYTLDMLDDNNLQLFPIPTEEVDKSWFPDAGTILKPVLDESESKDITEESIKQNTAIIHISFHPSSASSPNVISPQLLSRGLDIFTGMIRATYKRTLKDLDSKARKFLDTPDNYQTEVLTFSPGSFRIHLKAKLNADLHGYSGIERALRRMDEIFKVSTNTDKAIEILKDNKGHVVKNYRNLLEFIVRNDTPMDYTWASPDVKTPQIYTIGGSKATQLYDELAKMKELSKEILEIVGVFTKVDIEGKVWTVKDNDEKHYKGVAPNISLEGVIIGSQKYKFTVEEKFEESDVTGQEKVTYTLLKFASKR